MFLKLPSTNTLFFFQTFINTPKNFNVKVNNKDFKCHALSEVNKVFYYSLTGKDASLPKSKGNKSRQLKFGYLHNVDCKKYQNNKIIYNKYYMSCQLYPGTYVKKTYFDYVLVDKSWDYTKIDSVLTELDFYRDEMIERISSKSSKYAPMNQELLQFAKFHHQAWKIALEKNETSKLELLLKQASEILKYKQLSIKRFHDYVMQDPVFNRCFANNVSKDKKETCFNFQKNIKEIIDDDGDDEVVLSKFSYGEIFGACYNSVMYAVNCLMFDEDFQEDEEEGNISTIQKIQKYSKKGIVFLFETALAYIPFGTFLYNFVRGIVYLRRYMTSKEGADRNSQLLGKAIGYFLLGIIGGTFGEKNKERKRFVLRRKK